jgi:hypothetical protein
MDVASGMHVRLYHLPVYHVFASSDNLVVCQRAAVLAAEATKDAVEAHLMGHIDES